MESRIKGRLLSIIVAAAMIASTGTAWAASSKPSPKPKPGISASAKVVKKPVKKAVKKPVLKKVAAKTTKKPAKKAAKKQVPKKASKKPKKAVKKASKKKVVKKASYIKRLVTVAPSPSPAWPPRGFKQNGDVYAKVPSETELVGILSATPALASQVKTCTKYACGAVRVSSRTGCTWWEINSTVSGPLSESDPTQVPYGTLRTTAKATKHREIVTILLISTEPLKPKVVVGGINISCYHSPITEKVPSNLYTPNVSSPSPTPSEVTASPSPTLNTN